MDAKPGLLDHPLRWRTGLGLLIALVLLPTLAHAWGQEFYVGVASRFLIFALAATSLNLILGFGGMVSFGHAAFVGVGAYAAGILMQHGIASAWLALALAFVAAGAFALLIGAISLRTRGVYFIMITLAFAQMLYYLMVSVKTYGGDDGLSLSGRFDLGFNLDLSQDATFYYLVLTLFVAIFLGVQRLLNSRFGHALQAIRDNETRMAAIGFPVYRFKLVAFVLAGALAGLAGALLAHQGGFVSPSMMQWSESGMLMVMVILGGVGHLYGGLVGAVVFLALEELLSSSTIHWQFGLGAVLLAVVLLAPNGLLSLRLKRKAP
ncbi:branched-chain amino acid ABC transporter permease [Rhodoferax sp.]|uniref:branched-chain amino acid ABC transporter permease n=1 Tax=Rhodoferax sp. TaxID=50421 RepID=UPI002718395B|nr:branched-chain amino acid ABC transporter permease [Rhodoferax sp.]MDO9143582.1 branched-chain amino acid ABC transporter permease [Rhodoferax sp.]MDP3192764.1 branched-chain amino acid ABC transporter permease [Rhodoferax sp.]MDP3335367.1 branched-chain amino acid ABC transporter permease [Rhodoferax sp.]